MALDFFAGCVGGCAGVLVGHPFDTIKVHLQTQDFRNPKYRGTFHCFQSILQKESVSGLYRGMSSPMAGVAVINAIIFGIYGNTQRHMSNPDSLYAHFVAGSVAGFAQSFVCSPMELAKTRIQVQQTDAYRNPLHCLHQVFRSDGVRGVFKGLGLTMARDVSGVGTYFVAYEFMTRSDTPITTPHMLMAGGLAGTVSWILSYPADVLKSRLQIDGMNGVPKYKGVADCFRQSLRAEGYSFLARGLTSTLLRAFPVNAATFAVVTWTFRLVGIDQEEDSGYYRASDFMEGPIKFQHSVADNILGIRMPSLLEKRDNLSDLFHWRKVMMYNIAGNFFPSDTSVGPTQQNGNLGEETQKAGKSSVLSDAAPKEEARTESESGGKQTAELKSEQGRNTSPSVSEDCKIIVETLDDAKIAQQVSDQMLVTEEVEGEQKGTESNSSEAQKNIT